MARNLSKSEGILVIRLGALGDVVNVLPAVSGLRSCLPDVRIGWLVEEPSDELVASAHLADEIVVFPRKRLSALLRHPARWLQFLGEARRFVKRLRASGYGYVLDFQGNLKSGLLGLASGAGVRIGFAKAFCREMNWLFNNVLAMPVARRIPRAEKNGALAQALAPELRLGAVSLSGSDEDRRIVERFLARAGSGGPLVILHPGTSEFGEFKRWPAERFGELAVHLKRQVNARCVVTHGPAEEALASVVVGASQGCATAAPPLSVGGLVELTSRAQLLLAGDTGPLHIAALMQRPVVGIFGPKDPVIYGPYGTRSVIVRKDLECSPCARRRCDDVRCIEEITVEDVLSTARQLLSDATGEDDELRNVMLSQGSPRTFPAGQR